MEEDPKDPTYSPIKRRFSGWDTECYTHEEVEWCEARGEDSLWCYSRYTGVILENTLNT